MLLEAVLQLKEYLAGKRDTLTVPLQIEGTEFQKKVYRLTAQIPVGKVVTYSEIAKKLKKPLAVRSVGAAMEKTRS